MAAPAAALRVPLLDLQAQYRALKPEIDAAIQQVLARGQFILGPEVEALEREVAAYCGVAHAAGVASGTDALELSLRACGIGPGDEVITTAYSFFATAEAIVAVGAVPVFVDIEPVTCNLDPVQAQAAITPQTRALLPVHLYGHVCAMEPVLDLARRHGLKVVEDCAQAIGAAQGPRRAGSFGDAGALSFFPTKNLGGYGDGGMVVTNQAPLWEQVKLLRVHGSREKYRHLVMGRNSRLDELQAAILRVKLRHLDAWNEARRRHAAAYAHAFAEAGVAAGLPQERPGCRHVYHQFCIRTPRRDAYLAALQAAGIGCQVYYPSTLSSQPALQGTGARTLSATQAEAAVRELLALPMYPELSGEQIRLIAATLARA